MFCPFSSASSLGFISFVFLASALQIWASLKGMIEASKPYKRNDGFLAYSAIVMPPSFPIIIVIMVSIKFIQAIITNYPNRRPQRVTMVWTSRHGWGFSKTQRFRKQAEKAWKLDRYYRWHAASSVPTHRLGPFCFFAVGRRACRCQELEMMLICWTLQASGFSKTGQNCS